jgi:hypothetical protein
MAVTVKNILERIEAAGLPERWVRYNILPAWWDKDCDEAADHNPSMMAILEIDLMRVLGVEIEALRDEDAELEFKLDYAPKALMDTLKPKGDAPAVGRLVTNSGAVTGVR